MSVGVEDVGDRWVIAQDVAGVVHARIPETNGGVVDPVQLISHILADMKLSAKLRIQLYGIRLANVVS